MSAAIPHMLSVLKFAVVLGILIFVHEVGHFLMARLAGVHVKKFFLGFDLGGLKLFSFRRRETEYGIGILPLGGYVKMAGQEDIPTEDEEERRKQEEEDRGIPPSARFDCKPLWQRAAIVFAGPLMNILLGLVLFILLAFRGIEVFKPYSSSRLGNVEPGSPAASAGLETGDLVLEISGKKIEEWQDLLLTIRNARAGEKIPLTYERAGQVRTTEVQPAILPGADRPRLGIAPAGQVGVWVEQTDSAAARAGLKTGDIIREVNGRPTCYPAIEEVIGSCPGPRAKLSIFRPEGDRRFETELEVRHRPAVPGLYLEGSEVRGIDWRARGDTARLRRGDRVVEVDGEPVSPDQLGSRIGESAPGTSLRFGIERPGRWPLKPPSRLELTVQVERIGEIPGLMINYYPETVVIKYRGWEAVRHGWAELVKTVEILFSFLYSLITGRANVSDLAGPVRIFDLTRQLHLVSEIANFLALISVNLAIINLLPLPVLDGGHLFFFLLEGLRRRPLPRRAMVIAQQIGLFIIILIFILVTYNDVIQVFFRRG